MSRHVTVTLTINADSIRRALHKFARSMYRGTFADARARHGGNGTDARTWPEQWQSAACSAWLHTSCLSDRHRLGCTCTCHGPDRDEVAMLDSISHRRPAGRAGKPILVFDEAQILTPSHLEAATRAVYAARVQHPTGLLRITDINPA